MKRHFRRWIFVVLMLLTLWQVVGCHSSFSSKVQPEQQLDCHEVKHIAGTTCVPNTIKRLVTLDATSFENAIALGLKPVGTVLTQQSTSYLKSREAAVTNVGYTGSPNLERVLALKPDLIVGLSYHEGIYDQLSEIAPTLLFEFDHSGKWKSVFRNFGDALKQTETAQQVMRQYDERLQMFKHRLDSALVRPKISVVRVYPDSISLYLRDSFSGVILNDAGLDRPEAQNVSASDAHHLFGNQIQAAISVEYIEQTDGDFMFVWTSENTAQSNETAQKKLAELRSSRLWQTLKVVQNNQVYFVPSYWIGSGPLAANAVIDDLFKYIP